MQNYEVQGISIAAEYVHSCCNEKRQGILKQDAFVLLGGMVTSS